MRFDAAWSWIVSSAWPIVVSFVGALARRRARRATAAAAYARINFESYTFATRMRHASAPFGASLPGAIVPTFTTFREIPMRVGVPKEIKVLENRVGLVPGSVRELVAHGHEVVVEHNAGQGIGMDDDTYRKAGATVVATAAEVFAAADMIVKVKEPQAGRAQDAPRTGRSCSRICISRPIPSRRPISSRAARCASPTRP